MIFYRPTDGDVFNGDLKWRPRTCFVMAAMGSAVPSDVRKVRRRVSAVLAKADYDVIDAASATTGKDYLLKIWQLAVSCPVGIAIVHQGIRPETMANIFYELGWMQAYGRETVVIKVGDVSLPSDFVRTEYIAVDARFTHNLKNFIESLNDRTEYYQQLGSLLEQNPVLAVDYLRRAYLLTGDPSLQLEAKRIFEAMEWRNAAASGVERLVVNF